MYSTICPLSTIILFQYDSSQKTENWVSQNKLLNLKTLYIQEK